MDQGITFIDREHTANLFQRSDGSHKPDGHYHAPDNGKCEGNVSVLCPYFGTYHRVNAGP
ncbi:MAG TPA: hypothetical protein VMV49_12795 [Candidatus Deferrimicrobium sp.]|nr:hypothetical protein [Candidatus Deferrimicrobium sp.]